MIILVTGANGQLGNELRIASLHSGLAPDSHFLFTDVVDASDFSLEIPQYGTKHSLNVSVAVGVVLWELVR